MKPILILLVCLGAFTVSAITAEQFIVPIVVDIPHKVPIKPVIHTEEMSFVKAMVTLSQSSQKFGRNDPVIIRLESNDEILEAANFARHITELYDHVFIALMNRSGTDTKPLFLNVGRDQLTVDVSALFPSIMQKASVRDSDPNRVRDQQVENLRSYMAEKIK